MGTPAEFRPAFVARAIVEHEQALAYRQKQRDDFFASDPSPYGVAGFGTWINGEIDYHTEVLAALREVAAAKPRFGIVFQHRVDGSVYESHPVQVEATDEDDAVGVARALLEWFGITFDADWAIVPSPVDRPDEALCPGCLQPRSWHSPEAPCDSDLTPELNPEA